MVFRMYIGLIAFSSMLSIVLSSEQAVPALIWSPEKSMSGFDIDAADTIQTDEFHKKFLSPLLTSTKSGVVFLQDKLHVDDFTNYADVYSPDSEGGAFKNIKQLMEEHFSLELPQVADPQNAINKLKSAFGGDVHSVESAKDVEKLGLNTDRNFLLIVQLSPVSGAKDQEKSLENNDATVGAICRHLQKQGIDYTALFTGKSAGSEMTPVVESHSNRHILEVQEEVNSNGTLMNVTGHIFVYMRSVFVCLKGGEGACPYNFTLVPNKDTANQTTGNNATARIVLGFNSVAPANRTEKYNIEIITEVDNRNDSWVMRRISMNINGAGSEKENVTMKNVTLNPRGVDMVVPILYSFHCSDLNLYLDPKTNSSGKVVAGSYISLRGFQLQPFHIQNNQFFYAYDCVGFFTTAIWMGLFPVIFLLAILIFGILMVLNLSTMDRYDDPKGKTITVTQGE